MWLRIALNCLFIGGDECLFGVCVCACVRVNSSEDKMPLHCDYNETILFKFTVDVNIL